MDYANPDVLISTDVTCEHDECAHEDEAGHDHSGAALGEGSEGQPGQDEDEDGERAAGGDADQEECARVEHVPPEGRPALATLNAAKIDRTRWSGPSVGTPALKRARSALDT